MVDVLCVYKQLLNDPQLLQNGFQYITKFILEQSNFVQESINLIFSGLIDQERKFIAALLKQPLILNKQHLKNSEYVYFGILKGICQEKNEQIKQIMTNLLVNIGDISLLLENNILDQLPQYLNLLDIIIAYFINQQDEINKYANQILTKIQNINDPRTIQAVYYIIQSFSHLTGCDLKLIQQCFSPTYQYWLQVFILILGQPINTQNLMIQIYAIKSLYTIFISMKSFSKNERQSIIKPLQQFLSNLSQLEIVLDDINFEDDQDYIDSDYRVDTLIYCTVQLFIQLNEQLTGHPQVYQSMIQILKLPQKQSYIDLFLDDSVQGIKRGILQFFEYHLESKKTKLQLKGILQNLINNIDIVSLMFLDKFSNILLEQNQYINRMTMLVQSNNGLSYHCAVSIYIQTPGDIDIFNQLMNIFIRLINDPECEVLSIYNFGRLSAHALKHNTAPNLDLSIKINKVDYQYADKIYDSLLQIIKLCNKLDFPIISEIYQKWPEYRHDALIVTVFNEILTILAQTEEYWQQIFIQFQNSPDYIWLPVHIILAKKHPELLGSNIVQLCQLFQNPNNVDNFNYTTMLLTQLIKANPIDQQQLFNLNQVLQLQMDIYQELDLFDHVHDLLLVIWIKCLNKSVTQELLNLTLLKILRTDIPLVIQGLTTIMALFFLTDPNQFLQNLIANIEHYKVLFSKWLRFSVLIQQPTQKLINQCALQQLSFYKELDFDYRDAYTSKTQPIKSKILEFIISSSVSKTKKNQNQNEELEDNEDDEYDNDGEYEDIEQDIENENQEIDQFESNLSEFAPLLQQVQVQNINHLLCYKELLPEKLQKLF